jgi:glycosyltransferase involved in cell wall biosynthesis
VLQSLLDQAFGGFELIVSVDGSTDDTKAVLDTWLSKFPTAKAIYSENGGRSVARNRGASAASGELLIFIDDDMRLDRECLLAHVRHHERFPGSLVSGAQLYDPKTARTDFEKYKAMISENWVSGIGTIYPDPLPAAKLHLTAANFSVSKERFDQLGGFDERVPDMEDFLLAYTAMQQRIPVYYLHQALGWHEDGADLRQMQRRYVQYADAARQVSGIYPRLAQDYPRYRVNAGSTLKRLLYCLLSQPGWIPWIENNRRIPQGWRFRLYGLLLHAAARR